MKPKRLTKERLSQFRKLVDGIDRITFSPELVGELLAHITTLELDKNYLRICLEEKEK